MLTELEEVVKFSSEEGERARLKESWRARLELAQPTVEVWLRLLRVRSLVFPAESDAQLWIKFAGMCRKTGRVQMAQRILIRLLGSRENVERKGKSLSWD